MKRGYSLVVKRDLPKVEFRVRFPVPAPFADVAQLVEQYFRKVEVGGSSPLIGSIYNQVSNTANTL